MVETGDDQGRVGANGGLPPPPRASLDAVSDTSTMLCPQCGAEYLPGVTMCADCQVPLGPAPADELGDGDQVVYELADWEPDRRTLAVRALDAARIPYLWEGDWE